MGQEDIIKVLKRNKRLLTAKEIAFKLNKSQSSVNSCLNKLQKRGNIYRIFKQQQIGDAKIWTYYYKLGIIK